MPDARKSAGKSTGKSTGKSAARSPAAGKTARDALQLLTADHKEVKGLFKAYQKLVDQEKGDEEKEALARRICLMLSVHAITEEEILYPAARGALDEKDLLDEAEVEHGSAKELMAQIEAATPADALYDAKVKVLGEYVDHHVKEEENELFPKVRKSKLDLAKLGKRLAARKEELLPEMAA